jgi:diguanylate cyclase (GGDEF)-like protein
MNVSPALRLVELVLHRLPRGGDLPEAEFERRHRWLLGLLWLAASLLPLYSLARGYSLPHTLLDGSLAFALGLLAVPRALSRRTRAIAATLALSSAAAMGVHLSGGRIEAHFSFFVIVLLLTLYEDWLVFGLAVGFVLVHHGGLGMVDPGSVYNGPGQAEHPWLWAAVHALFVAAAGGGAVLAWRLNEDIRGRMREVQAELQRAASTDALTGLGNRRALTAELDRMVAAATSDGESAVLVLADLNGFKPYNDTFGHPAGDALLHRLGRRLATAVEPWAAFRLGGDEFCVVAAGHAAEAIESAVATALTEHGEGFSVTSSSGRALAPADATSSSELLRLADQRMYEQKAGGRPSAEAQSKMVLLRALTERHPNLGHNLADVADLAERVAIHMGLRPEEVERVRHAAELHDVGKVGIPDAILNKPGPLDEDEWAFMRRHTEIGERIIAAAPALSEVARLVRSTHERWDGAGYPDGLAREDIPLASRIVSACDAFDAMVSSRPYRTARNLEEALAELRRCAGTQFDPAVVVVFEQVLREPSRAAVRAAA